MSPSAMNAPSVCAAVVLANVAFGFVSGHAEMSRIRSAPVVIADNVRIGVWFARARAHIPAKAYARMAAGAGQAPEPLHQFRRGLHPVFGAAKHVHCTCALQLHRSRNDPFGAFVLAVSIAFRRKSLNAQKITAFR